LGSDGKDIEKHKELSLVHVEVISRTSQMKRREKENKDIVQSILLIDWWLVVGGYNVLIDVEFSRMAD